MNKFYNPLLFTVFFAVSFFGKVNAQQVFKTTSPSVIAYLEYLPQDYHNNSDKYPVVFFLHGIGERGPNSTDPNVLDNYIINVAKHGPPKHVKNGNQFPFILISPQLKNNYGTWTTSYIMEVINHCKTYLRIDERRIYLTGLSLGGGGTWVAAQDKPELFAAIAPVCGGYNSPTKACGIAAENLPVWAFHGDADSTVPYTKSLNMVKAINNCVPAPSPLALLTIYPGVGHNAWDNAYKTDNTLHNPNVYQWITGYTNIYNRGNRIPVANAGSDKTVSVGTFSLNGSGTDLDGSIASYKWMKISGPDVIFSSTLSQTVSLSTSVEGEYIFRLQVTDNAGNTDTDYVKVTAVAKTNELPVANAGSNKTLSLPCTSVTINGTATDPDGTIAAYKWSKVSGPAVTLNNTSSPSVSLSSFTEGCYVLRLTVNDNEGATDYDDVMVTVNPPSVPQVSAGADKIVNLPSSSTSLFGTASDNGTIVSYQWTKISGDVCTLSGTSTATLKVSGLKVSGCFVFRLTVKDNDGYTSSDDVSVFVNVKPVSNAGADVVVNLPLSTSIYLKGSGTDADGTITGYLWSKYSGPNVSLESNKTSTLKINKLYEGTYIFKLQVTDNLGVKAFDYVTVTVSNATATTSSVRADATTTNQNYFSEDGDLSAVFDRYSGMDLRSQIEFKDCLLTVFNKNGEQIYNGEWVADHSFLASSNGLFIYHVSRNGQRVYTGKIYKQ